MLAVLLAASIACSSDAFACASACGMPPPIARGPLPQRMRFGLEDRYLKENGSTKRRAFDRKMSTTSPAARWRGSPPRHALGRPPYVFKQITEQPDGEASSIQKSQGLGDAESSRCSLAQLARVRQPRADRWWPARMPRRESPEDGTDSRDEHAARIRRVVPCSGAWTSRCRRPARGWTST
jgi:hypothetical protein